MTNTTDNDSQTAATQWQLGDYITQRLDDQHNYHNSKASKAQKTYKRMRTIEIIAAAAIPISITFISSEANTDIEWARYISIFLGFIVAIVAGLMTLGDYQTSWLHHRATCEKLEAEKAKFLSRCEPYDNPNDSDRQLQQMLTTTIESILANEGEQWQQQQKQNKQQDEQDEQEADDDQKQDA